VANSDHEDRLLTLLDAAEYLGIHPDTLRRWVKAGTGPGFVLYGKKKRWRLSELKRFKTEGNSGL
jgi:excisionase family DNA binding protein